MNVNADEVKRRCRYSGIERGYRRRRLVSLIDSADPDVELAAMCNRYMPGERHAVTTLFEARAVRQFNAGPDIVHRKDPAWVVRVKDGELVLDQMTWGFPVVLKGKTGLPLKPKPVNNARFDRLGAFWHRWATSPHQRCLIPTTRFAEAVGAKPRRVRLITEGMKSGLRRSHLLCRVLMSRRWAGSISGSE